MFLLAATLPSTTGATTYRPPLLDPANNPLPVLLDTFPNRRTDLDEIFNRPS